MFNLFAFWLGGMVAGMSVALIALLFLRDFTLPLMREVVSAVSSPIVAQMQVAIGVLAVPIAALVGIRFWLRQREPVSVTGGEASLSVLGSNRSTGSSRLSIRGQLEGGSLMVAFVAGLGLATPPVEYLAAIIAILASGGTAAEQVGAALMFTLVAFTVAEVPLISYLATPAKTLAVVQRLNEWISARRQAIPAVIVGAIGVLLVVTGMGNV